MPKRTDGLSEKTDGRTKSKRILFTVKGIAALPIPKEGRTTVYDAHRDANGLAIRLDANGRRTFFWFRSVLNRPTFRSLGTFPATPIDEARNRARDFTGKLERWRASGYQGANPFEEPEAEPTLAGLVTAYIEKRVLVHAARPEKAAKECKRMLNVYLSQWKDRKLSMIREADVKRLHREIAEDHGQTMADRVTQYLRRIFFWAINKEKIFAGANPATNIEYYGCKSRERFLGDVDGDELPRLFQAMKKVQKTNPDLVDFVKLSLWTEGRRSDIHSMRWEDVSLDGDNVWRIPSAKGDKQYRVPLTDEAVATLKARWQSRKSQTWVFPSAKSTTGHIVEPKRGWKSLVKRAGIGNIRIHDLRRTLASWQAGLGTSLAIIGKGLGHKAGSSATAIYGRLQLDPVRKNMSAATAAIVAASKRKPKALASVNV
jgi:integrase